MRYTYNQKWHAHRNYKSGQYDTVIVPDQVADNQKDFDGMSFPALSLPGKKRVTVTLIGDDYDLNGSGTGDMCVRAGRVQNA